jgi:hypothetical protein
MASHLEYLARRIDDAQRIVDDAQLALQDIIREVEQARRNHEFGVGKLCGETEPLLQCALQQVQGGSQYIAGALRTLTDAPDVRAHGLPSANLKERYPTDQAKCLVSFCEGRNIASVILTTPDPHVELEITPQSDFSVMHRDILARLGGTTKVITGAQALLISLVTESECSVAVERSVRTAVSVGFTTAALLGLASKLLRVYEKKISGKGVFVTRSSKADVVAAILRAMPPTISCVNLLSGDRPLAPSANHPRLIVCTAADFSAIRTEDIHHLVIDDCSETTQQIFSNGRFCQLRDVVYRGPAAVIRQLPSPLSAKFHARLWSSERVVNIFDVQAFTMAKQVEELFASFPPGRNYLQTTQTNVFLQNVTVVPTLDSLPEDVDHLVIVDLPFNQTEIAAMLKKAAARFVTLVCSPPQRPGIVEALNAQQLTGEPTMRTSILEATDSAVQRLMPRY